MREEIDEQAVERLSGLRVKAALRFSPRHATAAWRTRARVRRADRIRAIEQLGLCERAAAASCTPAQVASSSALEARVGQTVTTTKGEHISGSFAQVSHKLA